MEEDDGSSKYPGNEIINPNGADAVGIFPSRTSDVHQSNTAEGQGSSGGTKLEGDGHNLGNIKYNISDNTITALKGESDVGMFSFHNIGFYWSNAGQGQGGREGNKGFLKRKGGSSSAQGRGGGGGTKPKGDGYNIRGNNIKGDGDRKAFHNFSNIEYNLKTTNTEDDGSTSQANIRKNTITTRNGASYVGMIKLSQHRVLLEQCRPTPRWPSRKQGLPQTQSKGKAGCGSRKDEAGDGLRKDKAGSSSAKEGTSKKPWYTFW